MPLKYFELAKVDGVIQVNGASVRRSESDYLDITIDEARRQWRELHTRGYPAAGKRQVAFIPIETLLSLAASFLVNHRQFGSTTADRAGLPVPQLAKLFKRPASSILAKMANLDGSRANGARLDLLMGTRLRADTELLSAVYRAILAGARAEGITDGQLPDFFELEDGTEFELLGQEELSTTVVEAVYESEVARWRKRQPDLTERETERLYLGAVRSGQHLFARGVLANCKNSCVFCGITSPPYLGVRILVASHIKPWRDSTSPERLDTRNGVAACPTHDRAFDVGLMTFTEKLEMRLAPKLLRLLAEDPAASMSFNAPLMRSRIDLAWMHIPPKTTYVTWHQTNIYDPNTV